MKLNPIVLEKTNKALSANAGLIFLNQLIEQLDLETKLSNFLPAKKKERGITSFTKFKSGLLSFASGIDCLDDFNELRDESLYKELCFGGISSRAMGDFLRSFSSMSLENLSAELGDIALNLRLRTHPDDLDFILTMDSTPHEQTGQKMEGVKWNYKNLWCLDSQNAYDQFGYSYGFDLRPGNTFSAEGSEVMIRQVFKKIPKNMKRYFRADSAYGRVSVYNELINANVNFAIVLRENLGRHVRKMLLNQHSMKWLKTRTIFFETNECETACGLYPIKNLAGGRRYLRVVFIRAQKKGIQLSLLDNLEDGYEYYSIITNMERSEKSDEEIIEFYRGRANAENFIREQKNGYDFHHFPCKKLSANKAYGLIGTIAYNLMRNLSFYLVKGGCFAKKVRNKLIKLPCQVVRHARRLTVRLAPTTLEVYEKILTNMKHNNSKVYEKKFT
jgi:hypothetical protein